LALEELFIALSVFVRIQSPFILFCSYGLIKRIGWLSSPKLVFPSVIGLSSVFYLYFGVIDKNPGDPALYDHFLFAAGFLLLSYVLMQRWNYSRPDALVISALMVLALDVLWQVPMDIVNWSTLQGFLIGITTAGWNLMSIPLMFYFVAKERRITFDYLAPGLFGAIIILTVIETARYALNPFQSYGTPYYLVAPWLLFFLLTFYRSKAVGA